MPSADLKVTVSTRGFDKLARALHVLGDRMAQRKAAEEDLIAAAQPIVAAARAYAPRDPGGRPGFGADTIHAAAQEPRSSKEIARIAIGPGPTGWHLRFSELGTSKRPAHPWLRPAWETWIGDTLRTLRALLGARIRKAWPWSTNRG